ncbi:MAG: thiamine phosphate synthase [Sulfurimonas sp.]
MKKYLITSPEFYTDKPEIFRRKLNEQILKHKPDYILYRDKKTTHYKEMAKIFIDVAKQHQEIRVFLHTDINLASKLNAYGVHLPSTAFEKINQAKDLGLKVIISTHTHEEVSKAESLGADYVTYSPIFVSPNKGKPKGIDDLKTLLNKTKIKVFALGGIVKKEEVTKVEKTSAYGFASIRYFQ